MKLYWLSTPCHHEDWFVYAWSKDEAEEFYEEFEDFNAGYSTARFIKKIPKEIISKHNLLEVEFAPDELLEELYLLMLSYDYPRIVMHRGEVFQEGSMMQAFSWPPLILN